MSSLSSHNDSHSYIRRTKPCLACGRSKQVAAAQRTGPFVWRCQASVVGDWAPWFVIHRTSLNRITTKAQRNCIGRFRHRPEIPVLKCADKVESCPINMNDNCSSVTQLTGAGAEVLGALMLEQPQFSHVSKAPRD